MLWLIGPASVNGDNATVQSMDQPPPLEPVRPRLGTATVPVSRILGPTHLRPSQHGKHHQCEQADVGRGPNVNQIRMAPFFKNRFRITRAAHEYAKFVSEPLAARGLNGAQPDTRRPVRQ